MGVLEKGARECTQRIISSEKKPAGSGGYSIHIVVQGVDMPTFSPIILLLENRAISSNMYLDSSLYVYIIESKCQFGFNTINCER
jgi:hypothetical protein